jgi:Protein of unknown function (DUF3999)
MRVGVSAVLLLQVTACFASAAPQYERYQRSVSAPSGSGQACAVVDAQVFSQAAPSLKDLRLYQDNREVPYAVTLSESEQTDSESARVLNLGMRGRSIVFDLEMPNRPYTDVVLDLGGQDFLATATVSGSAAPDALSATRLGEFTIFDLTTQHLSRSTTLHLQESSFRYLHVELAVSAAPGASGFVPTLQMVRGAMVPPSRDAQTIYTTASETATITQRGKKTIADFVLPTRVPVERVSFVIAPGFKGNFSRDVVVSAHPEGASASSSENTSGTILRVHLAEAGREIRQQQLSIPATLGSNLQSAAAVEVVVENGDDPPLPINSVRLEMRQRKLCFDAELAPAPTLFYGDPGLPAPQYDYARLFTSVSTTHAAMLGPQRTNPGYRKREDTRPLTERHPNTLWIALLAVISLLAMVAFRSSKAIPR